jgi:hypothetical protein
VEEERDAKEHHETNVGGERGTVFVDRVFGRAECKLEKSGDAILVGLLLRKEDGRWKLTKIVLEFGKYFY